MILEVPHSSLLWTALTLTLTPQQCGFFLAAETPLDSQILPGVRVSYLSNVSPSLHTPKEAAAWERAGGAVRTLELGLSIFIHGPLCQCSETIVMGIEHPHPCFPSVNISIQNLLSWGLSIFIYGPLCQCPETVVDVEHPHPCFPSISISIQKLSWGLSIFIHGPLYQCPETVIMMERQKPRC